MNAKEKQFYENGRLIEAEMALGNLYMILDQMTEEPHQTSHIFSCIKDLEKVTGMSAKDFGYEQNAWK